MSAMTPVPKGHPLMLAWEAHKKTEEYANSKNWAAHPQHVDGSLWALFSAGWQAAQPAQSVDVEKVREVIEEIAEQWHGCMYDAPGETVDISDAIRRAGTRLITAALQEKGNG